MPNQRKRGRVIVGSWVPEKLKRKLQQIAAAERVPTSTVIERMLREQSAKYMERGEGQHGRDGNSTDRQGPA
jgi:hypothetical protein